MRRPLVLMIIGVLCFSMLSLLHLSVTAPSSASTPLFSDLVVSNSFPLGGQSVTISVNWTILSGTLGTLIFGSNNTGLWTENQTYNPGAVSSCVWNVTLTCNSAGRCYVQWQECANSSAGYSNQTNVQSLYVWQPTPSVSSQPFANTSGGTRTFFFNGTHMVEYLAYQNSSTVPWHYSIAAYDLNDARWYYYDISVTCPSDGHWTPVLCATPNSTLILMWCKGSPGPIQYMLSTYTAGSASDTQKLISNWGSVQNVSSSVDSIGDAGRGGGDLYLAPLWLKNVTIIMDYVEPSGEGGTVFWESKLYYNDNIGWCGNDSTVFINGTSAGVSNSIYWNWYHDTQYGIMGAGSVQIPNTGMSDTQHYNIYFVYSPDCGTTWKLANGTILSTPISCSSLLIDNTMESNPSMSIMNSCPILDENGNVIIATDYFAYPTYSTCFGYQFQWTTMDYYNATPGSPNGVWNFQNITDAQSGNLIQGFFTGYGDSVGIIKDSYYGRPAFWIEINDSQIYYIRVPNSVSSFLAVVTDTSQPYCFCEPDGICPSDTASISYSWEWSLITHTMPVGNSSEPYEYDQNLSQSTIYGCLYTATANSTISEGSFYAYVPQYMEGCNYQIAVYGYNGTNWNLLGNSDYCSGLGSGWIYGTYTTRAWTGWTPTVSFSTPISLVSGTQYLICLYLNYIMRAGSPWTNPAFVYDDSTMVNQTIAFSTSDGFPPTITSPTYHNWSWDLALFTPCSYLKAFNAPHAINILSPQNTTYDITPLQLTFTVNESTTWIGYSLDNQSNVTTLGDTKLTGLSAGPHSIIVYAKDTSQNVVSSATVTFTIAEPRTIIVPDDYPTIQAAINAASDGDTIFVRNGTYYENVAVNKTVSLIGESESATVIDGNVTGNVFNVTSSNVSISTFTIQRSAVWPNNYLSINGLLLDNVTDCKISENIIANNDLGINILYSSNNSITENNITGSIDGGILLNSSPMNSIARNNIAYDLTGIYVSGSGSFNNRITGNNIMENNGDGGIVLQFSSTNNIVSRNNITNNPVGVCLYPWRGDHYDSTSWNNKMYHNNFINNTIQAQCGPLTNFWDNGYPSGGNYWSDYNGTDLNSGPHQNTTGSDGIGDIPYAADTSNIDHYPLMNPWAQPDIALVNLTASKSVVFQGYNISLSLTVSNRGNKVEGFNVTLSFNSTLVQEQHVILLNGTSVSLSSTWNNLGIAKGKYTLSASVELLPEETDIVRNNLTDGSFYVSMVGDLTGTTPFVPDGKVDGRDITAVARCFGSKLGDARYNPNCDLLNRGKIDGRDIIIVAKHFGEHE